MQTKLVSLSAGLATLTAGVLAFTPSARASEWQIDPAHTTIVFSVKHMMVTTVRGNFEKASGKVMVDDKDITKSTVEVTIDAASIDTGEPKRDGHLKSPDFFDVAKYPQIKFVSTKIKKAGKDKLSVTGDLTMKGVTKPVTLAVDGPSKPIKGMDGKNVRGLSATGMINRKDFGLNWNMALEAGGVLVAEEVKMQIDAELIEQAAAAPAK
jgi:polyisoprenoid-binding protein YceI